MRQSLGVGGLILALVLLSACEQRPEAARKELGHLGIAYTPEAFITSVANHDMVAVTLFLRAGMDPNTLSPQGIPALLLATMNCDGKLRKDKATHADIATALIAHGADVNVAHEMQPPQLFPLGNGIWCPLSLATRLGCHGLMQHLLQHGADVDARDGKGRTALIDAANRGLTEAVQILLDAGADIEAKTKLDGTTALMLAAHDNHLDIVQMLLNRNANINARNGNGESALMLASARGWVDVVRILLQRGADINARDHLENTALRNAEKYGGPAVTQLLRSAGAT
jgi:ankyrin repeat protein